MIACSEIMLVSKNSHRIAKQFLRHYRFLSQRSCRLSRDGATKPVTQTVKVGSRSALFRFRVASRKSFGVGLEGPFAIGLRSVQKQFEIGSKPFVESAWNHFNFWYSSEIKLQPSPHQFF